MHALTAAHRTLPFNTWLEVTDLDNGMSVNVRINDRGPFVNERIIDLSLGAAGEIGMVRAGLAKVRLKVIKPRRSAIVSLHLPNGSGISRRTPFCDTGLNVTEDRRSRPNCQIAGHSA